MICAQADSGCDSALLDMCRSLEEENRALSDTVDTLRTQLAEAGRDASINKLIPHYRLAIVRYVIECIVQTSVASLTTARCTSQVEDIRRQPARAN
jgi:hypothetical protein